MPALPPPVSEPPLPTPVEAAPAPPPDLYRKLVALTGARLLVGTALLIATAWITLGGEGFSNHVEGFLYGSIASIYVASLVSVFVLRRGRRHLRTVAYGQIIGDVVAASMLVYLTGGADSIFTILYPLAIVNAAIGLSRRGAVTGAVASGIAFCALAVLMERGLVEAPAAFLARQPLSTPRLLLTLAANLSAFLLTAGLASYLTDALQGARVRLLATETELTALSALHENIVRSITSGILTADGGTRITYINPAGEEITGFKLAELRGRKLGDRFPDFSESLRRSQPGRGETVVSHSDGGRRVVGYSLAPLVETGTPSMPGFVIVFQDLTGLRRMEEAVRRADRLAAVGKLAAGLAHEIRNPLTSMLGSIELLGGSSSLNDQERRLMGIVLREGERLDALVRDFLNFARPSQPVLVRIDASQLLEETVAIFRQEAAARGLTLIAELQPGVLVQADEGQLKQVLWNLLGNAADATGSGGTVGVRLRSGHGEARLEVSDSGAGIAPEDLPRIFDPFFTTKERGTGLGLAIVHRVVEAHGGRVEVRSSPGEGSAFLISLRCALPLSATG